jgi:hypothetical protein
MKDDIETRVRNILLAVFNEYDCYCTDHNHDRMQLAKRVVQALTAHKII